MPEDEITEETIKQTKLTKNEWRKVSANIHKRAHGSYKPKDPELRSGLKKLNTLLISQADHLVQ